MNTLANIQELARALRNMIRTGLVVETNLKAGRCRVQTGGMCTDWLQWLTIVPGVRAHGGHLPWGSRC
ncbi:phage-related baseplate assembly family protein [Escherichia coli p0305293.7]|nr:phage-related baseplate assembly family protein [Escherichia coli p0305293.7]